MGRLSLSSRARKSGFTLVELLVVIAIIGVLASVVLASLNSARKKSRDARRVADLKQLQLALELYFDSNGNTYPDTVAALVPQYLPVEPRDPLGNTVSYVYTKCTATSYHLGASLEEGTNPSLDTDRDIGLLCTGDPIPSPPVPPDDPDNIRCSDSDPANPGYCYDLTP
ncbi:MAG: prepilin-type N-terminal cleavage/methylation domain-containing protein [Candidatus Sungbacteria bacterium]|nr:prepilin-type N-terminal cleavage/methylation domain-containing protein [Candidatus Sungbacteria bacterium]